MFVCVLLSEWDGGRASKAKKPAARRGKKVSDDDAFIDDGNEEEVAERPAKRARNVPAKPSAAAAVRMTGAAKPSPSPSKKRPRSGPTLSLSTTATSSNPFVAAAAGSSSRKAPTSPVIDLSQLDEPAPARAPAPRRSPAAEVDMSDGDDLQEVGTTEQNSLAATAARIVWQLHSELTSCRALAAGCFLLADFDG